MAADNRSSLRSSRWSHIRRDAARVLNDMACVSSAIKWARFAATTPGTFNQSQTHGGLDEGIGGGADVARTLRSGRKRARLGGDWPAAKHAIWTRPDHTRHSDVPNCNRWSGHTDGARREGAGDRAAVAV
jgi:hypothetical protein